jgi:hypothetical protein
MLRRLFITFLILTLGFSPMSSVWAGNMASSEHNEMAMGSAHDHDEMMHPEAASDYDSQGKAKYCDMNCVGDCDSSCCSSGVCSSCGHCAAALINLSAVVPANAPYISPLSSTYTLESREFTPPFRPPLSTS